MALRVNAILLFALCTIFACNEREVEDSSNVSDAASKGPVPLPMGGALAKTYEVCSDDFTSGRLLELFNGNLVFVAEQVERGSSLSSMLGQLAATLVVNGLSFDQEYQYAFDNGNYSMQAGDTGYQFALYFAQDYGSYLAGEKIPYNLFAMDSYITGVALSGFPPAVSYTQGPLFGLISSSITFDSSNPLNIDASFRVRSELISFALETVGEYSGQPPREEDKLTLAIANTPISLNNMSAQIEAGTFGLDYVGSKYASVYYGLDQEFTAATFFIKKDATGYYWEGDFAATIEKDGDTMYSAGLMSQRQLNYTEYFCDEDREQILGRAAHDADLKGGSFTFVDGTSFSYRMEEF